MTLVDQWSSGAEYRVVLTNGNTALNGWKVSFIPPSSAFGISSIWNSELAPMEGERMVAVNAQWNAELQPGQSLEIGFIASKPSNMDLTQTGPTDFTLCPL